MARFQRLRWRSKVAGDDLAPWLVRQARDDPRWARGVRHRPSVILGRIRFDSAVGSAIGEAYGHVSADELVMDDLAFAQRCVQLSRDRHRAERAGVPVSVVRVLTAGR